VVDKEDMEVETPVQEDGLANSPDQKEADGVKDVEMEVDDHGEENKSLPEPEKKAETTSAASMQADDDDAVEY
jgi:hypothetical protein